MLVDSERGLVFAFAFFDNAGGDSRFGTLPDGRRIESGPKIPWTWAIAEVFKIDGGLIAPVESVLHQVPTAWAPGGALGKSRFRASRAADRRGSLLQLETHAQPDAALVHAPAELERRIAVLLDGGKCRGVKSAGR